MMIIITTNSSTSHQPGRSAVSCVTYQWWLNQSKLAGSQTSTKIKVSYIAHHPALHLPSQFNHQVLD